MRGVLNSSGFLKGTGLSLKRDGRKKIRKLIIYDPNADTKHLRSVAEKLKKNNCAVSWFKTIEETGIHTEKLKPDIIFLRLPEGLNKTYLNVLKMYAPVIGIIEKGDDGLVRKAFKSGIEDFIISPYDFSEIGLRVESGLLREEGMKVIEREKKHLNAIIEIASLASSTLNPQEILYLIVKKISEIIPVVRCSMIRIDNEHKYAYVAATFENPGMKTITLDLKKYPEIKEALIKKTPVIINNVNKDPIMTDVRDILTSLGIKSIVVLPVFYNNTVIGTLFLRTSRSGRIFTKDEIEFCSTVADTSANALYSAYLYEKSEREKTHLGKLAVTDYLTGLYNIRYLYHRLEEEFSRTHRYRNPLTCLMMDIDLFKRINDTYGHKTGDRALKEFALLLKKNMRKSDILARYGGEEFIVLLPNTSKEGSLSEAERLSRCIKKHKFQSLKGKQSISVSIGAATYPHENIKVSGDLITLADNALYQAKRQGRGRVIVYK